LSKLKESVELVKQRFNNASKFRQPLTLKWIDWYEKWRNYLPANQDEYRSNLFIPYSFFQRKLGCDEKSSFLTNVVILFSERSVGA